MIFFLISDSTFICPPKWQRMDCLKSKGGAQNNNLRIHLMISIDGKTGDLLGITDLKIMGDNIKGY